VGYVCFANAVVDESYRDTRTYGKILASQNTIQVTVAGVMGTWCFVKNDARSCCSPAVTGSLYRSLTYSFGSICMGSLLQAVVTALRVLLQNARNRSRSRDDECGAVVGCILECLVRLLEDIIDYFNQWAYVFVGIYGYSYIESGKKVLELFKARGISSIVTNDLVGYVLGFTTTTVAVVNGLVSMTALILVDNLYSTEDRSASFVFGPIPGPMWWSFGYVLESSMSLCPCAPLFHVVANPSHPITNRIGFLVGIAMASVMMSVVRGAINTLIVCYADAPGKLEDNHPEETAKLSKAWSSIHPKNSALTSGPQYSMVV
jgi:Plasma-membrane choline transporter